MDKIATVREMVLSDNSKVHDVVVRQLGAGQMILHVDSEANAHKVAEILNDCVVGVS